MNANAVGKGLLILAFVGSVGLGVGVGLLLGRDSVKSGPTTNVDRHPVAAPADVSTAERRVAQTVEPPPVQAPIAYTVKIPDTMVPAPHIAPPETSIIERMLANEERMLANEKRLGDALFVIRRDIKNFQDSVALALTKPAAEPARGGYAKSGRYDKSAAVRRAVEGMLK